LAGGISADSSNSTDSGRCPPVQQMPRYLVAKKNMPVYFICSSQQPHTMQWYKTTQGSREVQELNHNTSRYSVEQGSSFINFTIYSIRYEDSGIYVCDSRDLTAQGRRPHLCGTELRVIGHSRAQQIQNRKTLKDAIIIIQSILLVVFISVPVLLFMDKVSGMKESPEEDHTYEGLEVEQMATYEDITPFRDMKVKWTVGEHPGEE
ncbi:CD79B protein, partial [Eubucco bourcierii]|nr:CD79B protein [Eubucco bourcierii]